MEAMLEIRYMFSGRWKNNNIGNDQVIPGLLESGTWTANGHIGTTCSLHFHHNFGEQKILQPSALYKLLALLRIASQTGSSTKE